MPTGIGSGIAGQVFQGPTGGTPSCPINYSCEYDGNNQYQLRAGASPSFGDSGIGNFSVSFWLYMPSIPPSTQIIFGNGYGILPGEFSLNLTATGEFAVFAGPTMTGPSSGYLPVASWVHVAVSVNRSGNQIVYFDGNVKNIFDISAKSDVCFDDTKSFAIGALNTGAFDFVGNLVDVAIWNKALSQAEVRELYNNSGTCYDGDDNLFKDSLTHWWRMFNPSGIYDSTMRDWVPQDFLANSSFDDTTCSGQLIEDGGFDEYGPELVQGGDFALGSELILNGDFSETPLGSELVLNGDFSSYTPDPTLGIDIADWVQYVASGNINYSKTADGVMFETTISPTYYWHAKFSYPLYNHIVEGKSYKLTYRVKGYDSGNVFVSRISWSNGSNALVSQPAGINPTTWTYVEQDFVASNVGSGTNGQNIYFYNWSEEAGGWMEVADVSVKENISLVDNQNFSITGADVIVDGGFPTPNVNWVTSGTSTINGGSATVEGLGSLTSGGSNWGLYQTYSGYDFNKSYKITFTAKQLTGTGNFLSGIAWQNNFNQAITSDFVTYEYYASPVDVNYTSTVFGGIVSGDTFEIKDVSVEPLGSSWTVDNNSNGDWTFEDNLAKVTKTAASAVYLGQDYPKVLGESHKITYTVLENNFTGTGTALGMSTASAYASGSMDSTPGTHTLYKTVINTASTLALKIYSLQSAGSLTLTDVTVEVLGEDWIPFPADPDIISFVGAGMKIVQSTDLGNDNRVYQQSVTADTKSYKVTYTISAAQYTSPNSIKYYNGTSYVDLPDQGAGTYSFNYTRTGADDHWYFNFATATNSASDYVIIGNLSVKEILTVDDWGEGPGWSFGDGEAIYDGTGGTSPIAQTLTTNADKYHKVGLTVLSNTAGAGANTVFFGAEVVNATHLTSSATPYAWTGLSDGLSEILTLYGRASEVYKITDVTTKQMDPNDDWILGEGWSLDIDKANALTIGGGGTNLLLNPNFGSELVVDGDFLSAASWNVNSNWNINTELGVAEADGTSDADINQNVWLPVIGKSYKVTFEVISRSQGEVLFKMGGVNGQTHTTLGVKTEYIVATSTDRLRVDSQSSFIGSISNVSVVENEVVNGTFATDTIWSKNSNWTIPAPYGEAVSDGTTSSDTSINQSGILTDGVSYKISFEITEYNSGDGYQVRAGSGTTYSTPKVTALGVHTYYQVATTNDTIYIKSGNTNGKITNVSVEELGVDWIATNTGSGSISFVENGLRIFSGAAPNEAYCRQSVMVIGTTYQFTYTVSANSSAVGSGFYLYNNDGGGNQVSFADLPQTVGAHTVFFVALDTFLFFNRKGDNADITIGNLSLSTSLVQNPEFTEGVEQVDNPDFTGETEYVSTWTVGAGWVLSGLDLVGSSSTTENRQTIFGSSVSRTLTLTYTIEGYVSGEVAMYMNGESKTFESGNGTYTRTITTTDVILEIDGRDSNPFTGTITNISVKDLSEDWTPGGDSTISVGTHQGRTDVADININNTSSGSRIIQPFTFVEGTSYKVTVDVYVVSGSFRMDCLDSFYLGDFVQTSTTGSWQTLTAYIVAISSETDEVWLRSSNEIAQFYVDSASIEELGEDWSDLGNTIDVATYNADGLTITSHNGGGNNNRVNQGGITQPSKTYKVTYNIHSANLTGGNAFQYYNGTTYITMPTAITGTPQSFYYTTPYNLGNFNWYFRLVVYNGSTTDYVTISSLTVEQLSDTYLEQLNVYSPNKNYSVEYTVLDWAQGGISAIPTSDAVNVGNGTYSDYVSIPAVAPAFKLEGSGFQGSVTDIKCYEVDPQNDWTLGAGWTLTSNSAKATNVTTLGPLSQDFVGTGLYEIVWTVANKVGSMSAQLQAGSLLSPITIVNDGTYTQVINKDTDTFSIVATGTFEITSVVITKVGSLVGSLDLINTNMSQANVSTNVPT